MKERESASHGSPVTSETDQIGFLEQRVGGITRAPARKDLT